MFIESLFIQPRSVKWNNESEVGRMDSRLGGKSPAPPRLKGSSAQFNKLKSINFKYILTQKVKMSKEV